MPSNVVTLFPWPQLSAHNFAAFWQMYPKRKDRPCAERAWAALTSPQRIECLQRTPLVVEHWIRAGTLRRFIPYPATFINGRRWEDELEADDAPLTDYGQCAWNRNGNRAEGGERCEQRALFVNGSGHYCRAHARSLGLCKS